jgi:DNA-binding PadR family transcriptional regulator
MPRDELTFNATLVLHALCVGHRYGFDLMRATDLPSGTVYPILRRLEATGLVHSRWESQTKAHADGRPRRRYYEPSAEGRTALAGAMDRINAQRRLLDRPAADAP